MRLTHAVTFALLLTTAVTSLAQQRQPAPTAAPRPGAPPAAATASSAPPGYTIGPEDVIGVLFWREPEMTGDHTVRPDGRITLPLIGDLPAAGMTPEALRSQIQTAAEKFLTDANVSVVVRQLNSRKVFITGEVNTPGSYPLTGPRSVLQLIALAGGLTDFADSKNISIMRDERGQVRSFKFNYNDVSKGRKLEQNIQLLPGDTVVVP